MRVVGKYKKEDIKVTHLYMEDTYSTYPLGDLETVNSRIVNMNLIPKVTDLFGLGRPIHIVDRDKIDCKKRLPSATVYAWLSCSRPIKEWDGSHMVLVWFQDGQDDPFAMAAEKLKSIGWEKEAWDFKE